MNEIINYLNQIDTNIFLYFNGLHNHYWDYFMTMYSDRFVWIPFYASFLYVMLRNFHIKETVTCLLVIVAIIFICDQDSLYSPQTDDRAHATKQPRQSDLADGACRIRVSRWQIWISVLPLSQRLEYGILCNVSCEAHQADGIPHHLGAADELLPHLSRSALSRRSLCGHAHRTDYGYGFILCLPIFRKKLYRQV